MAKRALCEALSLDKPSQFPDSKPSNGDAHLYTTPYQASTYASSAENIARLLENWQKRSPKSAQTNSGTTQNSSNNLVANGSSLNYTEGARTPDAFDSLLSFNSSTSDVSQSVSVEENANFTPETNLFQDESKSNLEAEVPLTLLEKWLFDDGAAQGHEDLIHMSLEDGAGLF